MQQSNRWFQIVVVVLMLSIGLSACKKDDQPVLPLEPIRFLQPDTGIVDRFPGDTMSLSIQLTTDGIIDSLIGEVHIDSTGSGYVIGQDPTTVFLRHTWPDSGNLQTYTGLYQVPNNVQRNDVVSLLFTVQYHEYYHNIPITDPPIPDRFTYQKKLTIRIR
jgi:hypothetical protein